MQERKRGINGAEMSLKNAAISAKVGFTGF